MISNNIQFEAFKEVNAEQATAMQDAFANVFEGVCDDVELGDIPKEVQSKLLTRLQNVCVCVCYVDKCYLLLCACVRVCVCVCVMVMLLASQAATH